MKLNWKMAFTLTALALSFGASAQEYPSKPIRMIVPFGAGGPTDSAARMVAEAMSKRLGQTIVVENKAGAAGRIGLDFVANMPADGYNISFVAATLPSLESFYKDWKRDVITSYTYIGSVVDSPGATLWVPASVPGKTLGDALAYFKANPGKLNMAYTAPGPWDLLFEHLNRKYALNATRIAYKGTAEASMALLSGDVQFLADTVSPHAQDWKAGKVKPLALIANQRDPVFPDIPALPETNTSDYKIDSSAAFGIIGPAGMPAEAVNKLNRVINELTKDAELMGKLKVFGNPSPRTPEQFRDYIKGQRDLSNKLVKEFNIQPQ